MFTPIRRMLAGLAIAVVVVAGAAACQPNPPTTCEGLDPTITGSGQAVTGTSGDDVIIGTNGAEAINGLGGNDKICAAGGNDTITGGAGNDVIDGGSGTDRASYSAVAGPVTVNLATGSATGDGTDTLKVMEGAIGTAAGDTFTGNAADNTFDGGAGNDTFNTAGGFDICALGTGVDTATDCEAITGNVADLSEQDQLDYTVTNGKRIFFDTGSECPGSDIRWSATAPLGAAWTSVRICTDEEKVPTADGTVRVLVGGQGGTAFGNYSFKVHQPVDATGTIGTNGTAVTATTTVPGQNVRLTFSGTAGQRISASMTGATFAEGYFLNFIRPNGTQLTYSSHATGTAFKDTFPLDVSGTWTVEVNPNDDDTGKVSLKLHTVVDQAGTITLGPTVQASTTTPGQNARFTFSGTAGQKVAVRLTNGTWPDGGLLYLYRPNGSYLTYGSGFETMNIASATLDATGTWSIVVDPSGGGTGTGTLDLNTAP